MTSKFATYRSQGRRLERAAVVVRPATLDDAPAIGRISAARHDENEEVHVAGARREIAAQSGPDPTRMIFVAEEAGRVVGYGRLAYFRPPEAAPEHCIPEGWYLTGVVVTPERRNRGIGSRLTAARLDALRGRTDLVRYYPQPGLDRTSPEARVHRRASGHLGAERPVLGRWRRRAVLVPPRSRDFGRPEGTRVIGSAFTERSGVGDDEWSTAARSRLTHMNRTLHPALQRARMGLALLGKGAQA